LVLVRESLPRRRLVCASFAASQHAAARGTVDGNRIEELLNSVSWLPTQLLQLLCPRKGAEAAKQLAS